MSNPHLVAVLMTIHTIAPSVCVRTNLCNVMWLACSAAHINTVIDIGIIVRVCTLITIQLISKPWGVVVATAHFVTSLVLVEAFFPKERNSCVWGSKHIYTRKGLVPIFSQKFNGLLQVLFRFLALIFFRCHSKSVICACRQFKLMCFSYPIIGI